MIKLANKIAILVAVITFVMCLLSNISIFTAILRTSIVFVGVLLAFYLAGSLMKMGFIIVTPQQGDKQ
jgi:hypothetical protein